MNKHPVVTKDFPENLTGGRLVCGINFGYSVEDEKNDRSGEVAELDEPSFFSDKSVNNTRFRNRILKWLGSWGVEMADTRGKEGPFERSFFQSNWLDTQTNSVSSNGQITENILVQESGSFLRFLEARKPQLILFVGSTLIEALSDIRIRDQVESVLGARSGNAVIHRAAKVSGQKMQFKVLTQSIGMTQIISLPHTQTIGLSDKYMAGFADIIHPVIYGKL